jgi:hypothetical protein
MYLECISPSSGVCTLTNTNLMLHHPLDHFGFAYHRSSQTLLGGPLPQAMTTNINISICVLIKPVPDAGSRYLVDSPLPKGLYEERSKKERKAKSLGLPIVSLYTYLNPILLCLSQRGVDRRFDTISQRKGVETGRGREAEARFLLIQEWTCSQALLYGARPRPWIYFPSKDWSGFIDVLIRQPMAAMEKGES